MKAKEFAHKLDAQKSQKSTIPLKNKLAVVGLVALPVAAAVYETGSVTVAGVYATLAGGPVAAALTLLSWGMAAKLGIDIRKKRQ